MWNLIICDDEADLRADLRSQLDRFSKESGEEFRITDCSSAESLLFQLKPDTDLIFLDIKMDGMNGMDAAREVRARHPEVCIIFLTSMVQYAVEGYSVHAWGFLRKPLSYAQLRLQMADTMRHLHSLHSESISLQIGHETHKIPVRSLTYAEVLNHTVALHLQGSVLEYYGTIAEIETLLDGKGFFRCHKSFLVNLQAVRCLTGDGVLLLDGSNIPVSKRRRKEFQDALTTVLGSVL